MYTGSVGGGRAGSSMGMKEAARKASTVADLFFFIVPFSFFKEVATMTKKYSYKDWAVERFASRRDRSKKKRLLGSLWKLVMGMIE